MAKTAPSVDGLEDLSLAATDDPAKIRQLSPASLARLFHQPALIYFNAVSRHLSIREAARRLNTAPSAITRQIAHLEGVFGFPLFTREGKRLKLAPAGEALYRYTRDLTAPLTAAMVELDMLRGLKVGTVRIASVESVGLSLLPTLIADFGMRYRRLHLTVTVTTSADVLRQVLNDEADVGFAFLTKPAADIEVAMRRDVAIGALMSADHPLVHISPITLASCVAHPFAVATPHISIRDVIEPFLHHASLSHLPFIEVDSIRMLVELASTGRYISIMTPIGAEKELADGTLVFRPLQDKLLPRNRFGIIVKAGANLNYAAAVFFEHAKQRLERVTFPA